MHEVTLLNPFLNLGIKLSLDILNAYNDSYASAFALRSQPSLSSACRLSGYVLRFLLVLLLVKYIYLFARACMPDSCSQQAPPVGNKMKGAITDRFREHQLEGDRNGEKGKTTDIFGEHQLEGESLLNWNQ